MSTATTELEGIDALAAGLRKFGAPAAEGRRSAGGKGGDKVVFRAAEKSAEFFDHLRAHYRETRRTSVEIPCDVRLVLGDGSVFDSGTAVVSNVSPSGALLTAIKLAKGCFPAAPFKVVAILKGSDYHGIGVEATPVRLAPEMSGLGVRFDEIFVAV